MRWEVEVNWKLNLLKWLNQGQQQDLLLVTWRIPRPRPSMSRLGCLAWLQPGPGAPQHGGEDFIGNVADQRTKAPRLGPRLGPRLPSKTSSCTMDIRQFKYIFSWTHCDPRLHHYDYQPHQSATCPGCPPAGMMWKVQGSCCSPRGLAAQQRMVP